MSIARTESYIGKPYNFIGSVKTDLILETIGKVYIKRQNQMLPIESVIEKVIATKKDKTQSVVIILKEGESIPLDPYPGDGVFVFDPENKILYITYDEQYNVIFNGEDKEIYVKLTGDTMTGQLQIELEDPTLPPFVVNTQVLVENLNADMLDGKHAEDFLNKEDDYEINGKWTFTQHTKFSQPISSKNYNLNCNTNGWYLDQQGNLTVKDLTVKGELRECNKVEEEEVAPQFTDEYVTKGLCGDYWVDIQFKLERIDWVEPIESTGTFPVNGIAEIDGEDIEVKLHDTLNDIQTRLLVNGYDGFYCVVYLSDLAGSNINMISVGDTFKSYIRGTEVNYYSFVVTNIIKDEDYIEYIIAKTSYINKQFYGTRITNCSSQTVDTFTHDKYSSDINDYVDGSEDEEEENGYVVADPTDDTLVVRTGSKFKGSSSAINISTIHDDGPSIAMYNKASDMPRVTTRSLNSSVQSLIESNTLFKMGRLSNLFNQFTQFNMPNQGTFINPLVAVGTFLTSSLDVGYLLTNGTIKHFEASHPECGDMKINERGIQLTSDGKLESAISTDVPFGPNIKNYINQMIDEKISSNTFVINRGNASVYPKDDISKKIDTYYYSIIFAYQEPNSNITRRAKIIFGTIPNLSTLNRLVYKTNSLQLFDGIQSIVLQEIRENPSSDNNNKIMPNGFDMHFSSFEFTVAQCAAYFIAITCNEY